MLNPDKYAALRPKTVLYDPLLNDEILSEPNGLVKDPKTTSVVYQCPLCDEKKPSRPELRFHMRQKHAISEIRLKRIQKVMENKVKVVVPRVEVKEAPDTTFKNISGGRKKPKATSGGGSGGSDDRDARAGLLEAMLDQMYYNCRICFMAFVTMEEIEQHVQNEHGDLLKAKVKTLNDSAKDPETYKWCWHCFKTYANKNNLIRHVTQVHYGYRPYFCCHCEEKFIDKRILMKHLETDHQVDRNNNKSDSALKDDYEYYAVPPNFHSVEPLPKDMYFIG